MPDSLSLASTDLAAAPESLELRPVDGLPRWLGGRLARFFLRLVSMEENDAAHLARMVTPTAGYFRRDRHVHPEVDPTTYRLNLTGLADPRSLDLAELQALPRETRVCVQECAGNGNHIMGSAGLCGQALWSGPTFESLLELCGGPGDATHFAFHGQDTLGVLKRGYHYGLSLAELRKARAIVALTMNGEPLSRRHGFPARLIVPQIYSMSHVKWLCHVEGKTRPHMGIHNRLVFTNKELHAGKWVRVQARWIGLKSVIAHCTREGSGWLLTGCAWGGERPIASVELSCDGGLSWQPAHLQTPAEFFRERGDLPAPALAGAWGVFTFHWLPPGPGTYKLGCRAIDSDGNIQQLDNDPKVHGHFNQTRVKWRSVTVPERRLPPGPA
ncbi:MAG: molybdopterin-dependent oxidoreductase [Nannocystis sp.]|uniref:molybdopterin-dependent oxidoreductase n=1 Tax=Nannocystis sp. TaxID=1962667 RepID=UPI0024295CC0|nr:molybdopterin-dependent oxidoreductase [Nannocystis sp.]MBK9754717.1 molybdopterin-dependent oxidoreductase [Nannocystis sp.]